MRKNLVAGNWKMNLSIDEATKLAKAVVKLAGEEGPDVLLCPSYTLICHVHDIVKDSRVKLGAQNLFWESKGAFTGEISADMIVDAGCSHVIIGHSERRQYFGETDASVQRKTAKALEVGLTPVVCVGETLDEREEGQTEAVIERQISGALAKFKAKDVEKLVLAYEPVWAIGTGQTATPAMAEDVHALIRAWLREKYSDKVANGMVILYGGSVKGSNASELFSQEDIDGGLIGGASLKADEFAKIIEAAR